jgi:hypothetical protein
MPTPEEKPTKGVNVVKDARVPTVGNVGTLNHDEAQEIKNANGGSLKECIHGLTPGTCKVCNGYVRRLIETQKESES